MPGEASENAPPLRAVLPTQKRAWPPGFPESGWVLVIDESICSRCAKLYPDHPPCKTACSAALSLQKKARIAPDLCNPECQVPCIPFCVSQAFVRTPDGSVGVNDDLCVGCSLCVAVCPTHAISVIDTHLPDPDEPLPAAAAQCAQCTSRIGRGLVPICVTACPLNAMYLGNLDRNSAETRHRVGRLSELIDGRPLHLGACNRVVYLQY